MLLRSGERGVFNVERKQLRCNDDENKVAGLRTIVKDRANE